MVHVLEPVISLSLQMVCRINTIGTTTYCQIDNNVDCPTPNEKKGGGG